MSIFASTAEALVVGLTLGAAFISLLYMVYQMLMMEIRREIREKVRERIDSHKEIYHKD